MNTILYPRINLKNIPYNDYCCFTYNRILYQVLKKYHVDIFSFHLCSLNIKNDNVNTVCDNINNHEKIYNYIIPQFYYSIIFNSKNKFTIIKDSIITNNFLTTTQKDYILYLFSKSQKHYRALCKFAYIYKYKKFKHFDFNTDLLYNDLKTLNKNIKIELIENNIIYTFRLSDLNNLIYKSLTHNSQLITESQNIKNPFTNIGFSICNLYNIYFAFKRSNFTYYAKDD